ncbi:MAG: Hsp20/alpha crystallin family protein [Bacteriovorax sp.]|nr:Hsp20/alpha crystallin family protein [Bacteriovorax sp.]
MKAFFLFIFLSTTLFAKTKNELEQQQEFHSQLEEIMKVREEMLKALMDDSASGSFEKRMNEIMKRFSDESDFGFGQMEGPVVGEYDWIENDTTKTLKIKVKQIKDHPLDIKIQKGEIKIKGDVESVEGQGKRKVSRKINFERSFSLPEDVDQTSPEFENKNGEMLIKFKKLKITKAASKSRTSTPSIKKDKAEKPIDGRTPISLDKDDRSI